MDRPAQGAFHRQRPSSGRLQYSGSHAAACILMSVRSQALLCARSLDPVHSSGRLPIELLWIRHHLPTSAINLSTHEHNPRLANLAHDRNLSRRPSRVCWLPSVGTGAAHSTRKWNARSATNQQASEVARDPCEPLSTGRTSKGRVAREGKRGSCPEAFLTSPGHLVSPTSVTACSDIAAAIWYRSRTAPRRCPAKGLAQTNGSRCLLSPETPWPKP